MLRKVIFLLIYFLSPIVPILTIYSSNPTRYSDLNALIPMILGSAAFTWLVAEFILSARPKFIEKFFGLDKFYRFHGLMAVISLILAFIHKLIEQNAMGEFFTTEVGDKALFLFIAISILSLLFMVDSIAAKIKPLFLLKKFLIKIKIAKYEYQVAIHNLTIVALIILLVHVLLTYSAKTNIAVSLVYILYFSLGAGFYLYHRVIRLILLRTKRYVIDDVISESANMWTIKLVPEGNEILRYKPGQFGFIRIFGKNVRPEEHPFSFSSEPTNKDYLAVTVKELGDFTSKIKNVEKGDKAFVDGPYGSFSYLDHPCDNGLVLIAGGVGITPAISMLRYMRSKDIERKVVLIWGVNNRSDLICKNEFDDMLKAMKNFVLVPVMFKDDSWKGEKGIIDKEKIEVILKKHGLDISSKEYFICGPSIMLNGIIRSLKALGVKKKSIHFERFSV